MRGLVAGDGDRRRYETGLHQRFWQVQSDIGI